MSATKTVITAEELLRLPEGDGRRELIRGELREMAPTSYRQAAVVFHISGLLSDYLRKTGVGTGLAGDPGFILERGPDTVRAPDIAVIRTERTLPLDQQRGFTELAPDLAIEVLSPDDRPGEVREKIAQFFAAGVRAVWLVDPEREVVQVHLPGREPRELRGDDVVEGGAALPGFRCPAHDCFPK